jgi:hypothetical protein
MADSNETKDYYSHPDQDPNSMIPHHESFGRHWFNHHQYIFWAILFLFFASVLSVVYWWQTDNLRIELPGTSINQNSNLNSGMCVAVIARARNPQTGEVRTFPTPCDVPAGWEQLPAGKPLATLKMQGGLCITGSVCETVVVFHDNGEYLVNWDHKADMITAEVAALKSEIAKLDFTQIKSNKFTGTCPIAYDGQEHVYTFFNDSGVETEILASCTYELDETQGAFKNILSLVEKYSYN